VLRKLRSRKMQQIKLRGNRVAVEKIKKVQNNKALGIVMPEAEEYVGVIKYVGESAAKDLEVGQRVYFGTNFQNVRMGGVELCVMEDSQVYASISEA